MAKRLRQANLFETLAKKRATDEIEPSALLEELPVSGELCDDESDDSAAEEEMVEHEADLSREAVIESSVCEVLSGCGQSSDCQSLCCADETKAYQPTNAQTLLSINKPHAFTPVIHKYYTFNYYCLRLNVFCMHIIV